MGYKKAEKILPIEILELVQEYIDGECIYIPRKDGDKKPWGSNTETKKEIEARNENIYYEYIEGKNTNELAEKYFLSIKTIQKIIRKKKLQSQ